MIRWGEPTHLQIRDYPACLPGEGGDAGAPATFLHYPSILVQVCRGYDGKKEGATGTPIDDEDEYCLYAANDLPDTGGPVTIPYDEFEWKPVWLWAPAPVLVRDHRPIAHPILQKDDLGLEKFAALIPRSEGEP